MAENTIKEAMEEVAGYIGEKVSEKEDVFRYSIMPAASEDNVGKSYQYTGTTNANFTHNYFYECVAQETDPVTYAWEAAKVQSIGAGGRPIMLRMDDGWRPYIALTFPDDIPAFEDLAPSDLIEFANMYYNDDILLTDIQNKWQLGDTMTISLSAMASTGVAETHAAQEVELTIVDFEHGTLSNSIKGKTSPFMTLGFKLAESGAYGTPLGGWSASARRTWCNDIVIPALPSVIQDALKAIKRKNGSGGNPGSYGEGGDAYNVLVETEDKIFIPNITEYTGDHPVPYRGATDANDSTQYELFKTASYFSETGSIMSCSGCKQYRSSDYNYHRHLLYGMDSGGNAQVVDMSSANGIYILINI